MRPGIESLSLTIDGTRVAGIRQRVTGSTTQSRMLCIHGWLDNANSFVPLMPHLPAFDLVALDLPGHGHSDHLVQNYDLYEMTYWLIRVMDALEWDSCHVVGHSLGGSIATLLAVAIPDRLMSLTLVEATGPLSEPAQDFPDRLRRSMNERLSLKTQKIRHYPDKQSAVDRRLQVTSMHPASARLIVDRQLEQTGDGFQWRYDRRWQLRSPQYQTEDHVLALLSHIQCDVLAVIAEQGYLNGRATTSSRLSCIQSLSQVILPGHHHVHMDTPEPVAAAINRFLEAEPDLGR